MTDRELMQMSLDWMDRNGEVVFAQSGLSAVLSMNLVAEALRARLAQPEPEPLDEKELTRRVMALYPTMPVRATEEPICAPPQREWQGLTDEEIKNAWSQLWYDLNNGKYAASDDPLRHTTVMFAREIEAKLKEKNA